MDAPRLFKNLSATLHDDGLPYCGGMHACNSCVGETTRSGNPLTCNHMTGGICTLAFKGMGRVFETARKNWNEPDRVLAFKVCAELEKVGALQPEV